MIKIPFKPPEFSHCDVEILEKLIFSKRLFSLSKEESSQKLRFVLPPTTSNQSIDFSLALKADHYRINLALKPTNESDFIKCLSEFGGKEKIPEDFLTAVVAFCSQKIIRILEYFFQTPISLEASQENRPATKEEKKLYFEIISEDSLVDLEGEIEIPLDLLKKLLVHAEQTPCETRSDLHQFPFQGEIIIGTTKISPLQFSKLSLGDLIFFEEPSACTTGEGFIYFSNNQRLPILLDTKKLNSLIYSLEKVTNSPFIPKEISDLDKETDVPETGLDSLEKLLKIELAFSVGSHSLTMDEMIHSTKIKKTPAIMQITHPLKIFIQGVSIGAGELMELHGQHAIFITQLKLSS
jgi:flagellar motor switch/type III secretory pathway protein FliN